MQKKQREAVHRKYFDSPIGRICIEDDGEALTGLYLQNGEEKSGPEPMRAKDSGCADEGTGEEAMRKNPESSELLEEAQRQLFSYFAGERTDFDIPLHLHGTEFQMKVWNALRQIPYGETRTYAELAAMVGNPKACRAVGGANNKNPIMIFVPCHRVIGADGSLVGFGGGLYAKRFLLELEAEVAAENAGERARECADTVQESLPAYDD